MEPMNEKTVREIVNNVRNGIRTIPELKRCGCPNCSEAMRILGAK